VGVFLFTSKSNTMKRMKHTLLVSAKPGVEEVEVRTNKLGQIIPAHIVRINSPVWTAQGEQRISQRLHRKYMEKGRKFAAVRKSQIANRKGLFRYSVNAVTEAALNGQYERIVSSLTKYLP
jgi:hypothetical protein